MLELRECEAGRRQLALLQITQVVSTEACNLIKCAQQGSSDDSKMPCRQLSTDLQSSQSYY